MKRKYAYLFSLAVIFSLLLAACGGGAATPTNAPQPTTANVEPTQGGEATTAPVAEGACPASAQGQSIEMWSPLTGPDGDEMSALAQTFSSENGSGVTVTHVAQPDYVQKLNAAAAANGLPAMTVVRAINVAELVERHVIQPMSDEALGLFGADIESQFPANVWAPGEYKGTRYTIPLDLNPLVMYYNKDMFAAAGLDEPGSEPMSKADFEAALEKLASTNPDVAPIAIGTAFQGATLFQTLIVQFGGSLANPEGTQATFNSDAGVQALTYVNDLKQKYSPDISGSGDPEVNVFKQQQAAIVMHGPWHISDLVKLPWVGFAPMPQIGDKYAVWAGSHQLALTTTDPAKQAAAACWMNWLSQNSVNWAKAGQVPARTSARESADLATVAAPINAVKAEAAAAILLPQVPQLEGALWDQFGPVVDAVLMGETTDIKPALDTAAAASQQVLEENAATYASGG
jgi:multiple sugar transport system substrate-binding protein